MWKDPIVEEVRKVGEAHAAQFDYNLDAIYRDLKEQERKSARAGERSLFIRQNESSQLQKTMLCEGIVIHLKRLGYPVAQPDRITLCGLRVASWGGG